MNAAEFKMRQMMDKEFASTQKIIKFDSNTFKPTSYSYKKTIKNKETSLQDQIVDLYIENYNRKLQKDFQELIETGYLTDDLRTHIKQMLSHYEKKLSEKTNESDSNVIENKDSTSYIYNPQIEQLKK